MRKDKITIAYILVTITIVIFASIYFIKPNFEENNTNIKEGAKQAFNTGKIYSDKMYTMINGYASDFMDDEDNASIKETTAKVAPKFTTRPVLTQTVNRPVIKTLKVSKLKEKVLEKKKKKKKVMTTGKLIINNNTNTQLIKETL